MGRDCTGTQRGVQEKTPSQLREEWAYACKINACAIWSRRSACERSTGPFALRPQCDISTRIGTHSEIQFAFRRGQSKLRSPLAACDCIQRGVHKAGLV